MRAPRPLARLPQHLPAAGLRRRRDHPAGARRRGQHRGLLGRPRRAAAPAALPDPERLVAVWPDVFISNQDINYWREHTRSFERSPAQSPGWMMGLVADGGEPIKVTGATSIRQPVSQRSAPSAALGRALEPGDCHSRPAPRGGVVGRAVAQALLRPIARSIGRTIQLDQETYTIVGVMPAGFEIFEPGTDLWAPLPWAARTAAAGDILTRRGAARTRRHHRRRHTRAERPGPGHAQRAGPRRTTGDRRCACRRCRKRSPATCGRRC